MPIGETLLLFGLTCFFIVVVIAILLSPRMEVAKLEFYAPDSEKFRSDNKYCTACGKLNTWNPEGGVQYDARDGRPYYQEVWGCSVSGHTFNRLIPQAQRRDYGDATAP